MNIVQLRAFVAVIDRGSFSAAAREMGISQPAVTMQIQALEADLGVTLLDRRYRRVDVTEAGRALLPHARRVLQQLEEARSEIAATSETVSGRLRIAASTTPGVYIVPRHLGAFVERFPEVGVSVAVGDTVNVVEAIESGEADIGVAGSQVKGARVQFEEIGKDELVLVAEPGHHLAAAKGVPLSELCEETWIFRETGSGTRLATERILAEHGLDVGELRVAVELGTGEAILSAVEGGLGIAVVSRYVAQRALQLGTVAEIAVFGLPFVRPLYAVLPKGSLTRAASEFHNHLSDALSE